MIEIYGGTEIHEEEKYLNYRIGPLVARRAEITNHAYSNAFDYAGCKGLTDILLTD